MADTYSNPDKYVELSNGVKMPMLGLGSSLFGGYDHSSMAYGLKQCGYRHIDTAQQYGSEADVAKDVKESGIPREDFFLVSKVAPNNYGKEETRQAFKQSLQNMETEYLDAYLMHIPYLPTGARPEVLEEAWRALELLYDEGLVRSIGVSNFLESHLEKLIENSSVVPQLNQCEFHPMHNTQKLIDFCRERSIQFTGFSPLGRGGLLTKPAVVKLSEKLGKTPAQVLIRWSMQHGVPTIPKTTNKERMKENSQVFDFKISESDMIIMNSQPQNYVVLDPAKVQQVLDGSRLWTSWLGTTSN